MCSGFSVTRPCRSIGSLAVHALCDGPTRAGRLGQAAGETAGAGEALGGVRRSVFSVE